MQRRSRRSASQPGETRRQVTVRGIDLNALVGRRFRVGEVECLGPQRLCEPCAHLQRLTAPGILKDLAHRAGINADIVVGGVIRVGDAGRRARLTAMDAADRSTEFVALGHAGSEHYAGLETFPNPGVRHVEMTSDEVHGDVPGHRPAGLLRRDDPYDPPGSASSRSRSSSTSPASATKARSARRSRSRSATTPPRRSSCPPGRCRSRSARRPGAVSPSWRWRDAPAQRTPATVSRTACPCGEKLSASRIPVTTSKTTASAPLRCLT